MGISTFRRFQSHILIQRNGEMKLKYKVKGQKVYLILYITLQRIQISFILYQAIVISLTISRLLPLQNTPLVTTTNLLQTVDF